MALIIAAGGTGGHVFPALAVAQTWRERWSKDPIYWLGVEGGREAAWVQRAGFEFYGLPAAGWQPGHRWRNLSLLYRLPRAFLATERLLNRLQPKGIFSTGGYPGFMPGIWAALHRRPLYLLELNRHAGRTIRWLSRFAVQTFGAFPETEGVHASWTGVPVRFIPEDRTRHTPQEAKAGWGCPPDRPLILILGGSQGSSALNRAVATCIPAWVADGAFILWQVGKAAPTGVPPEVRILPFIEDMVRAYTAADLVISRAGGSTLGELAWWGKASVLVPSPHVAEDHQRKNAAFWAERNAALVVEEHIPEALAGAVRDLLREPARRAQLAENARTLSRPDAAEYLATYLHEQLYGTA